MEYNHYEMRNAAELNDVLDTLPVAQEMKLLGATQDGNFVEPINRYKAIRVENGRRISYVYCPTKQYRLVQHKEAFRPIIEALTLAGYNNYKFVTKVSEKRAELQIYVDDPAFDTVSLGFNIVNSFDGSRALSYGMRMDRSKKYIELVGYRQVCSNGMKMRVPLHEAEFVKPELLVKLDNILQKSAKIKHTQNIESKMLKVQYVVEAVALLREPVQLFIRKARKFDISDKNKLKQLIIKHAGKRMLKRVTEAYDGDDLWDLYNAMTYVASHDDSLREVRRDSLLNNAADMLVTELQH